METAAVAATEGAEAAASILPSNLDLNPINQISPVVIMAVIVIITLTYFALRRVYVLPYLGVLEERERLFEAADLSYVEAARCVDEANTGRESAIAQAAAEAEAIRAHAREQAEAYRRETLGAATAAAASRLEDGRAQIAAARAAELSRLQAEAEECVGLACQQLMDRSDPELVSATVERLMTRQVN